MSRLDTPRFHLVASLLAACAAVAACGGGSGGGSGAATPQDSPDDTPKAVAPAPAAQPATGSDPIAAPAVAHGGPTVDATRIPTGHAGWNYDRIYATSEVAPLSDIGAFRTFCEYSHMAFDDPIVYPGQPGKSHLHTFFGNTATNAHSTAATIASSGNSTCRGGTANRSAYWVPSTIDTRTGAPVKPHGGGFYYKSGYNLPAHIIQVFPTGLRMIAGDAKNASPNGAFRYKCVGMGSEHLVGRSIQNCPVGAKLWQEVFFPQCWDGVNLDSPDHKSHMAYPEGGRCPSSHPVAGPEITFNIEYTVTEPNQPTHWRLSSDTYDRSLPAGYSMHGDWINGWKPDVMRTFITRCDQASRDCHSHLLGDGRAID